MVELWTCLLSGYRAAEEGEESLGKEGPLVHVKDGVRPSVLVPLVLTLPPHQVHASA